MKSMKVAAEVSNDSRRKLTLVIMTSSVCPKRWHLSKHCSSIAGFHAYNNVSKQKPRKHMLTPQCIFKGETLKRLQTPKLSRKDNRVRLRTSSRKIGEDGSKPNLNPNPKPKPNAKPITLARKT